MSLKAIEKNLTNQAKIARLDTQLRELLEIVAALQSQADFHSQKIAALERMSAIYGGTGKTVKEFATTGNL